MNERLVAIEQSVSSGEQIALQPALALMLAEHLHHAAAARQEFIVRHHLGLPLARGRFEYRLQAVGQRLIRTEQAEIALLGIHCNHVAQEAAQDMRVADARNARRGYMDRVDRKSTR